eukprot:3941914-Rhodomonas_salina.6
MQVVCGAPSRTGRNQTQETAISEQFVPGIRVVLGLGNSKEEEERREDRRGREKMRKGGQGRRREKGGGRRWGLG